MLNFFANVALVLWCKNRKREEHLQGKVSAIFQLGVSFSLGRDDSSPIFRLTTRVIGWNFVAFAIEITHGGHDC